MGRKFHFLTIMTIISVLMFIGCQEQAKVAETAEPIVEKNDHAGHGHDAEAVAEEAEVEDANSEQGTPKIEFESVVHDFGEIGPGSKNDGEFKFTNTGDGTLTVKRIKSTCGCTVPKLAKKEYAPGESGVIKVQYKAAMSAGNVTKQLYVYNNDESNPKTQLSIKAQVKLKVKHSPERLNLLLKEENAGCPDLTFESVDGQEFAITGFKSTNDGITVNFDPNNRALKHVLSPKVDVEKFKAGGGGRIDILMDHPECKSISIGFSSVSKYKLDPPSVIIFNVEPNKPETKEVWVLSNYDEDFEINSITSKSGFAKILSQEKKDNRYTLMVEVNPPVEPDKKIANDILTLDMKDGEKLTLNIRCFYKK